MTGHVISTSATLARDIADGLSAVRALVHAIDLASSGLADDKDMEAFEHLCMAIEAKLEIVERALSDLQTTLSAAAPTTHIQ